MENDMQTGCMERVLSRSLFHGGVFRLCALIRVHEFRCIAYGVFK